MANNNNNNPLPATLTLNEPFTEFGIKQALQHKMLIEPLQHPTIACTEQHRHMVNVRGTQMMLPWRNAGTEDNGRCLYVPSSTQYQVPGEVTARLLYFHPRLIACLYGTSEEHRFTTAMPLIQDSAGIDKSRLQQFMRRQVTDLDRTIMVDNMRNSFPQISETMIEMIERIILPARFADTSEQDRHFLRLLWVWVVGVAPCYCIDRRGMR